MKKATNFKFEIWDLPFVWSLELGAWSFLFSDFGRFVMSELNEKQTAFLAELLKGREVAAILEDLEVHYKELLKWRFEKAFEQEWQTLNGYLQIQREADIRSGANEALRRARITVEGGNMKHWLSERQRRVGKDLVALARNLDPNMSMNFQPVHSPTYVSPIHPDMLPHAAELLARMERLRQRALEERGREMERRAARKALPAPEGGAG
jgi:hypothetical protein